MESVMRQWTVDAFAAEPFRGNPACVVEPMDAWPDPGWMQALAAENNQAETAFLIRTADPGRFGLRWFTPSVEVPLCGHATLASAHVLLSELDEAADEVSFHTASGPLRVTRRGERYEMDFPAQPPRRVATPPGLAKALGAEPLEVWASSYLVVVLDDDVAVRSLKPDMIALARVQSPAVHRGAVGVAALVRPGRGYDVIDRFFAPGMGIPEDPATGSLHCILSPLFSDKLSRTRVTFHQAYPGRGGELVCETYGDRVLLCGRAVTVAESRLRLRP
jgi:PhzF family phenazine biosynthesis protein